MPGTEDAAGRQGRDVAHDLLEAVNCYSFSTKEFVDTVCDGHRTLQQEVMRLMWATIQRMAEMHDKGDFDLRNEDSVKLAKRVVSAIDGPVHLRHV